MSKVERSNPLDYLSLLYTIVITIDLVFIAYKRQSDWKYAYRHLNLKIFALGLAMISISAAITIYLIVLSPAVFGFSWLNLLGSGGQNINFAGAQYKYFGILFMILLLLGIPTLAKIEEDTFRAGTKSWKDGFKRSIIFGFVHMIVGTPLAAVPALTLVGMYYTYMYFLGGVKLSAQAHFQYNLSIIGGITVLVVTSYF